MAAGTLVTKADFRTKVWDHLEKNGLAEFPRPVHHRIPNFKGAAAAAHKVAELNEFSEAKVVKINPDKPQETVRFLALEAEKTVLVPTPRLRHGLFNQLVPPSLKKEDLHRVARAEGVRKFSTPVGLDNIVPVNLIVVGSVAVSKDGYRIGKGEGYADLEYAMALGAGAVSSETLVVTTVHDDQVFDRLPAELFGAHDLTVDLIVTPTQVIRVTERLPKPTGIIWKLLTPRKLKAIPILKVLREREQAAGKDVTLGEPTEAERADLAARRERRLRVAPEGSGRRQRREKGGGDADATYSEDNEPEPAGGEKVGRRRRQVDGRRRRRATNEPASSDAQEEPDEPPSRRRRPARPRRPRNASQTGPAAKLSADESAGGFDRPRRNPARRERPPVDHADGLTVIVKRIPSDARPRDLREAIQAADSPATILSWKGRQGEALLRLRSAEAVDHLLAAADRFRLVESPVQLEVYDPQLASRRRRTAPRRVSTSGADAELTVFVGRLPSSVRVSQLREALTAAGAADPVIAWKGRRGMAFIRLKSAEAAEQLVANADKLKAIDQDIIVERYKGREQNGPEGRPKRSERSASKSKKVDDSEVKTPKGEDVDVAIVKEAGSPKTTADDPDLAEDQAKVSSSAAEMSDGHSSEGRVKTEAASPERKGPAGGAADRVQNTDVTAGRPSTEEPTGVKESGREKSDTADPKPAGPAAPPAGSPAGTVAVSTAPTAAPGPKTEPAADAVPALAAGTERKSAAEPAPAPAPTAGSQQAQPGPAGDGQDK